jgi:hypothetical protein
MVAVFGNLQPQDDYTHELGPEENFNESMYFNFFDPGRGDGGFARIGNRANEGYAEVTLCLYLSNGDVLFNYHRPRIEHNDAMDAGGMRFEIEEPFVRHRTTYDGGAVFMTDPSQLADPGKAFRENPHKRVNLDISHQAIGPVYGSAGNEAPEEDAERSFARAHYEQHMATKGTITIDGETLEVDGAGLRDHSWGPRYWQAIYSYRWLTCAFGPDFGIMLSEVSRTKDEPVRRGVVVRGETLEQVTDFELDSQFEAGTRFHTGMTANVTLGSGEQLSLEGRVKGFVPLRNRRAQMVTHIGEGMTEYRCDGRVALGISEYLDQVQ